MRNFFSNRLILIESLIILLPIVAYYIIGIQNKNLYPEFLINIVFIALLLTLFIFRSSSIRHMYFAFIFLILTVLGDILGSANFVYISSSLALGLLVLGVLNLLLFKQTLPEIN